MLTPQDLKDKRFQKAVFGGYDMSGVDAFLETIIEDYTTLFTDNVKYKSKLKVLIEKVEEYRSVDDDMRKALLTAQQKAQDITASAQQQADEVLRAAETAARERINALKLAVAQEEARLNAAKKETMRFVGQLRELYRKEVELLSAIPSLPVEENPKAVRADLVESAARDIDDSLAARIAEEDERAKAEAARAALAAAPPQSVHEPRQEPVRQEQPRQEPSKQESVRQSAEPAPPGETKVYEIKFGDNDQGDLSDIWEPEEDTVVPKPRTDFEDLDFEFGPNYNPAAKGKRS